MAKPKQYNNATLITYRCKCNECGLEFLSYHKVDLCTKHYWEFRDYIAKHIMQPQDCINKCKVRRIRIYRDRLPNLYKIQNRK